MLKNKTEIGIKLPNKSRRTGKQKKNKTFS